MLAVAGVGGIPIRPRAERIAYELGQLEEIVQNLYALGWERADVDHALDDIHPTEETS